MTFSDIKPISTDTGIELNLGRLGLRSLDGVEHIKGIASVTMLVLYLNNIDSFSEEDIQILKKFFTSLRFINVSMCNIETNQTEMTRIKTALNPVKVISGHRSFGGRSVDEFRAYWRTYGIFLSDDWK